MQKERTGVVLQRTGGALERTGSALDRTGVAFQRTGGALDRTWVALSRTGGAVDRTDVALMRTGGALDRAGVALQRTDDPPDRTGGAIESSRHVLPLEPAAAHTAGPLIVYHYILFLLLYSYYLKLVCEIPLFITAFIVAVKRWYDRNMRFC